MHFPTLILSLAAAAIVCFAIPLQDNNLLPTLTPTPAIGCRTTRCLLRARNAANANAIASPVPTPLPLPTPNIGCRSEACLRKRDDDGKSTTTIPTSTPHIGCRSEACLRKRDDGSDDDKTTSTSTSTPHIGCRGGNCLRAVEETGVISASHGPHTATASAKGLTAVMGIGCRAPRCLGG